MSVPSMVHRSAAGDTFAATDKIVRNSRVGDDKGNPRDDDVASKKDAADANNIVIGSERNSKDLPDCKVRRNYTCSNCEFFTQNPRQFLYHLRDVHRQRVRIYECPDCIYASKHFQKLLRHRKMVHGTTTSDSAPNSNQSVTSRLQRKRISTSKSDGNIDASEENVNNQPNISMAQQESQEGEVLTFNYVDAQHCELLEYACSVCTYTARSRQQLSKHEREDHIKTKFFRCSKCTYVTHIKARYTKHVKYHSMPMIKCDMCDFRTPYKWNLDRHCKNHNGKGLFKCSVCNFTADIKQSLTVHEMNHHTPPVGQAAGLGVGRRRVNKVGASDSTNAEANSEDSADRLNNFEAAYFPDDDAESEEMAVNNNNQRVSPQQSRKSPPQEIIINIGEVSNLTNGNCIISCKQCAFKTNSDAEMAKHEINAHNINHLTILKTVKKKRPIPNLIPIPAASLVKSSSQESPPASLQLKIASILESSGAAMSQADISDICSKSANSSLKDFASLFSAEDVFRNSTPKVPDLIPTSIYNTTAEFKQKNASFFDKLKEKLELGKGSNLVCNSCGYESKCLTEHSKHQKACGREINRVPSIMKMHNISASRCQYCRQRCKSSVDLFNHLQTCEEAIKQQTEEFAKEEQIDIDEHELKIDEDRCDDDEESETKPHPMENKVFVWNDIIIPMDIEVDDSNYEYTEDRTDEVSLDLSTRTQSPTNSESNTIISQESNNNISYDKSSNPSPLPTTQSEKVPTHGNDISVAQHKRVFKCPHCTFWASTASRFHVHIVGHLNKKPFECSLCSYKSNWRWDITKHIKLKSVRDHAHESAKVLMTDETGRRNYTKYNKYLTEIPLSSLQSTSETSGGAGTRPRNQEKMLSSGKLSDDVKLPVTGEISVLKPKQGKFQGQEKKRSNSDNKRMLFKCKRCNHRDASKENLLQHVKEHYNDQHDDPLRYPTPEQLYHSDTELSDGIPASLVAGSSRSPVGLSALVREAGSASVRDLSCAPSRLDAGVVRDGSGALNFSTQDLSLRGTSPDRDERHCRLKHSGDIRVITNKNGQEKIEFDEQAEDMDIEVNQTGAFRCSICPFSTNIQAEFENHYSNHLVQPDSTTLKCSFCKYYTSDKEDLLEHLKLHGVNDPNSFLELTINQNESDAKKFRCPTCPYITNSKSQYSYHKTFHKARGGEFSCSHCSYNVSKRHLLHQHLKVHGINVTSYAKHPDNDLSVEDIRETPLNLSNTENSPFEDIPLVWASKNGKFQKMHKCRFCPHVNLRKINIQDHEKMHSPREKTATSTKPNEIEHRCAECSYVCNNAGVLSSHAKVHQGVYCTVHCLVDLNKTDEEQLQELRNTLGLPVANNHENSVTDFNDTDDFLETAMLYFCKECPGRFLKENEFAIHKSFHNSGLPYKCDICSYATQSNAFLMSHLNVHAPEYQQRTQVLKNKYNVSPNHPAPSLQPKQITNGDIIYDVNSSKVKEISDLAHIYRKPSKFSQNVPISGTDLFQQKSEAQLQHSLESETAQKPLPDPISEEEYAILMQGNPDFTYATVLKNGKVKEKRYKCHKCPSAFEKREQYKIHLGLHGANQRYNCEICDYSVKYYANFVQHQKKHKFSDDAQSAKLAETETDLKQVIEDSDDVEMKLNVADQQIVNILQERQAKEPRESEDRKMHWCQICPYVSTRKDAVESHQKRHASISGITSSYACEHCDYSVPQAHYLRDHTKLHFVPNKINPTDGFIMYDNLKLTSNEFEASNVNNEIKDDMVFEEHELKVDVSKFAPLLDENVASKFNNNMGEKQFINVQSKNLVIKKENSDKLVTVDKDTCQMEVN